jgi:hypothetical protein
MKHCTILTVLAACLVVGSPARAEVEKLTSWRTVYDKSLQGILAKHQTSCTKLAAEYLKALRNLKETVQKQGDLEGLKAVSDEAARFEIRGDMPDNAIATDQPELASLQTKYRDSFSRTSVTTAKTLLELAGQYEKRLVELRKELTQQGKIEEATEVDTEIGRLKASDEIAAARFELAEDDAARIREAKASQKLPAEPQEPEDERKKKIASIKARAKRKGKSDSEEDIGGLLKNGGFNDGKRRWDTDKGMRVIEEEDNQFLAIELDNNKDRYLRQRFKRDAEAGGIILSTRIKAESDEPGDTLSYTLRFSYVGGSTYWARSIEADGEWKNIDWNLAFLRGGKSLILSLEFHPGDGTIYLDDTIVTEK